MRSGLDFPDRGRDAPASRIVVALRPYARQIGLGSFPVRAERLIGFRFKTTPDEGPRKTVSWRSGQSTTGRVV
jgi:hypothetical protein